MRVELRGRSHGFGLRAPAYRLNAAPGALRQTPRNYVADSVESLPRGGLRQHSILRKSGEAVGEITTHADDVLGRGEPDLPLMARRFSEKRFGTLSVQERPCVRAGAESAQKQDFSVTFTREDFTKDLEPLPTSPTTVGRLEGTFDAG